MYENLVKKSLNWLFFLIIASGCGRVQKAEAQQPPVKTTPEPLLTNKVVVSNDGNSTMHFVNENAIYSEAWDTLAQPRFWKQIICLSPDSCIINIASSRTPLQTACYKSWIIQSEFAKTTQKNDLRSSFGVDELQELYVTNGKKEFYEHRKTIPTINKAVGYFNEFGVDPWYAQTILLIESPGKISVKSSVGANGPFQLMKSVAMKYGLKVNKTIDERSDLKRSAFAASRLISTICIPKVKDMLDSRGIAYNETDLFFRLLVLHAYHAGAGNLACAMNKLSPTYGGQKLITELWHTESCGFRNESQNYSQIALAAIMNFEEILRADGDTLFMVQGDRGYQLYKKKTLENEAAQDELRLCLAKYERDLVDGTISFDYFMKRTEDLRFELGVLNGEPLKKDPLTASNTITLPAAIYPTDENHYIVLGNELLRKRKVEDAIRLLRFNAANFPGSSASADSLSKAYRIGGASLSQKYQGKSGGISKKNAH